MEIKMTSLAISFAFVAILTGALRVLNWVWLRPKKLERCLRQQGLTGNSYRLFYGDMKESSMMSREATSRPINLSDDIVPRVLPFIYQSIKHYGKNSFIWIGPTPRVNIMDPELIRDILSKINFFPKPHTSPLGKLLVTGLVTLEGEEWAKRRKIINPAFHQEKLKNMLPVFYLSCSEMISKWEMFVSTNGSCELDVWPYLDNLTGDAISRTIFGSSYGEGRRISQLQKEQANHLKQIFQSVYIPGWRFLPTKTNKRMKEIKNEVQALLKGIVNKREKAMKDGKASNHDLLDMLLKSDFKEIQEHGNKKNVGLNIEEVTEECKQFYFAGQETTSCLLVWTMILLSKHQNWQARAREEVLQVFTNKKLDFDELSHLKIVTMILYEVLRLYPPAPMLIRTTNKMTKLGELSLPPGVQLSLPTILVHHDHEIWGDDAKDFNPERFSEGVLKATKSQFSFFPFSWGPRICIGQNFAMMEAKMTLAMILQRFSFELSPSYVHAPFNVLTLQPQYGAQVILRKI